MAKPIEFHFDFSSPYGYLAAETIEDLAARHGREVDWSPILLGITFKLTGNTPLVTQPLKGPYSVRDFARSARYNGVPFNMPSKFPISSVNGSRAFLWLKARDPAAAKTFAKAVYRAYFVDDRDPSDPEVIADIAAGLGHDRAAVVASLQDAAIKDQLRVLVEAATARGVFGSPFFFIDDEPFWGNDRFPQMEKWLASGGF